MRCGWGECRACGWYTWFRYCVYCRRRIVREVISVGGVCEMCMCLVQGGEGRGMRCGG